MQPRKIIKGSWFGRGLEIDLAGRAFREFEIPAAWARDYLGGTGLAARLLYSEGNQQDLMIAPGLLVGLPIFTASKTGIAAISPLTQRWGESNMGGELGIQIKRAGFDLVWIRGKSEQWITLKITDDRVEFEPAKNLLGLTTSQTESSLQRKFGRAYALATIGPAAEKDVRFACIRSGDRTAGRCGMGTDWARRKIKAIAVSGSRKLAPVDPEAIKSLQKELLKKIRIKSEAQNKFGTACGVVYREGIGDLPVKNFALRKFPGADKISGQAMVARFHGKRRACPHCPIACAKQITVPELNYQGPMPEYETVGSLGSLLLIDDPLAVIAGNRACNEYGMDTITAGAVAGFALECFENGLLTEKDFHPIKPEWGSGKYLLELLDAIAQREGIGELLALGSRKAALTIGRNALDFAMQAHGLELAMHDPRAFVSLMVSYSIGTRGGSHNEAMSYFVEQGFDMAEFGFPGGLDRHKIPGKGKMVAIMQDLSTVYDNLGVCKFMYPSDVGPTTLCQWLKFSLNWEMTREELAKCGERSFLAKYWFNLDRLKLKPDADLPARVRYEIKDAGADAASPMQTMLKEYYESRGWSQDGRPPEESRPSDQNPFSGK